LQAVNARDYFLQSGPTRPQNMLNTYHIIFAHNEPAYKSDKKWSAKVTQVGNTGDEVSGL